MDPAHWDDFIQGGESPFKSKKATPFFSIIELGSLLNTKQEDKNDISKGEPPSYSQTTNITRLHTILPRPPANGCSPSSCPMGHPLQIVTSTCQLQPDHLCLLVLEPSPSSDCMQAIELLIVCSTWKSDMSLFALVGERNGLSLAWNHNSPQGFFSPWSLRPFPPISPSLSLVLNVRQLYFLIWKKKKKTISPSLPSY